MHPLLPTILAIGAAALMFLAMVAMYAGNTMAAGLSFLSASLVLYLRETTFAPDGSTG